MTISVAIEVGPILRLFTGQNVPGNWVPIKMGLLHTFVSPRAFEGIEILVFKHRLIERLL